jgi:hypothetical protein
MSCSLEKLNLALKIGISSITKIDTVSFDDFLNNLNTYLFGVQFLDVNSNDLKINQIKPYLQYVSTTVGVIIFFRYENKLELFTPDEKKMKMKNKTVIGEITLKNQDREVFFVSEIPLKLDEEFDELFSDMVNELGPIISDEIQEKKHEKTEESTNKKIKNKQHIDTEKQIKNNDKKYNKNEPLIKELFGSESDSDNLKRTNPYSNEQEIVNKKQKVSCLSKLSCSDSSSSSSDSSDLNEQDKNEPVFESKQTSSIVVPKTSQLNKIDFKLKTDSLPGYIKYFNILLSHLTTVKNIMDKKKTITCNHACLYHCGNALGNKIAKVRGRPKGMGI